MNSAGQPPRGGLGWLAVLSVLYILVAPAGFLTLPLAAILASSQLRSRVQFLLLAVAAGVSLSWLLTAGELPDQTTRAAAVIVTGFFLLTRLSKQMTVTHRSVVSVAGAAATFFALYRVLGHSWRELRWWVEQRWAFQSGLALTWLSGPVPGAEASGKGTSETFLRDAESVLHSVTRIQTDYFPAILAIAAIVGLWLAAAIARRLEPLPSGNRGTPRLTDFRFSEHVGWLAVIPLVVVLLAGEGTLRVGAANVLVVAVFLYAVRGFAVMVFGLRRMGLPRFGFAIIMVVGLLFLYLLLPGIILLGVLDARLDFRNRWTNPPLRA